MTRRPICLLCLLLMSVMCLADMLGFPVIRGNPLPDNLQAYVQQHPESAICGEVERCAETEVSQSVYLKNTYLIYQSKKYPIRNVRVFLKENEKVPAGTVLLLSGKLERVPEPGNPGEFDSRQYYACRHIYYFLKKAVIKKKSSSYSRYGQFLLDVQEKAMNVLERTAGEDAPVFAAVVLGDRTKLDDELKMRYQMAGIIHVLAISGLHISILGLGLYQLLKRAGLGIWPAGMIALVIMLQYGMMTGGSVSAMRAVIMFLLSVGAKILGRIYDLLTGLSLAAVLILLESPAYLYSSGFLLSFGAVLGIGVVAPALCKFGEKDGGIGKFAKALLYSLAVQVTMLPVNAFFFGEVSLAGTALNLFVLPTAGIVLTSGLGAIGAGFLFTGAGIAAALPGRALLWIYEKLCGLAGGFSFCTWIVGQPKLWQTAVYYTLLGLGLFLGKLIAKGRSGEEERNGKGKRRAAAGVCCALITGTGTLLLAVRPEGALKITCLDVGQGDGAVVETPEGRHFLIDCGSSSKSEVGQYVLLPYLKSQGISYLDAVFISHTDEDHICAVEDLLKYTQRRLTTIGVGTLFLPKWKEKPESWEKLCELARKAGVRVVSVSRGMVLRSGTVEFEILAPEKGAEGTDVNGEGMVLQAEWKNFRGIFTGDIGEETEEKLLSGLADVDFLKVGHHGSKYSSGTAFLQKIRPELGVISCSAANPYGHPSPDAIERLESAGCSLKYTMKSGAVTIETDGNTIRWEGFRECGFVKHD